MPKTERRSLVHMVAERRVPLIEDVLCNDMAEQDESRRAVRPFDPTGLLTQPGAEDGYR